MTNPPGESSSVGSKRATRPPAAADADRQARPGHIKSKARVAAHGEVFTPPWLVAAMLDLVKDETERIDARFLERACGSGNSHNTIHVSARFAVWQSVEAKSAAANPLDSAIPAATQRLTTPRYRTGWNA